MADFDWLGLCPFPEGRRQFFVDDPAHPDVPSVTPANITLPFIMRPERNGGLYTADDLQRVVTASYGEAAWARAREAESAVLFYARELRFRPEPGQSLEIGIVPRGAPLDYAAIEFAEDGLVTPFYAPLAEGKFGLFRRHIRFAFDVDYRRLGPNSNVPADSESTPRCRRPGGWKRVPLPWAARDNGALTRLLIHQSTGAVEGASRLTVSDFDPVYAEVHPDDRPAIHVRTWSAQEGYAGRVLLHRPGDAPIEYRVLPFVFMDTSFYEKLVRSWGNDTSLKDLVVGAGHTFDTLGEWLTTLDNLVVLPDFLEGNAVSTVMEHLALSDGSEREGEAVEELDEWETSWVEDLTLLYKMLAGSDVSLPGYHVRVGARYVRGPVTAERPQ